MIGSASAAIMTFAVFLTATSGAGRGTPAEQCASKTLRAAAGKAAAKLKCEARGAAQAAPVRSTCLSKAEATFGAAFHRAERKGGCPTTANEGPIENKVDAFVNDIVASLPAGGTGGGRQCAASKLKATGNYAANELRCHARAMAKGAPVDMDCLDAAEAKFRNGFAKAEKKGGCAPGGDVESIDPKVDAFADDVVGELSAGIATPTTSTTIPTAVSFSADVQPIFTMNCALPGCHTGATPAAGQDLSEGSAYASIVNVTSGECPSFKRVLPGAPDMSYLVFKIRGSGPCFSGGQMPFGRTPLSSAARRTIVAWIGEGAANN
jgi:hypothetical protein